MSAANGNDGNSCGFGAPCRNFQRAHNQTNDQGEITVLNPGDYGMVTVKKSISIVNDGGGEAGVQVSGGTLGSPAIGITIDAPNAYVNLRGLTIQGIGSSFQHGFSSTMASR